jgi:hypothetical protein
VSGLGVVDGGLVVFLYLCRFLFLSHHIEDATIGNDFSFEGMVDIFDLWLCCGGWDTALVSRAPAYEITREVSEIAGLAVVIVHVAAQVCIALEVQLHEGSHRLDIPRSGVALELESILLAILDIAEKVFEEVYVTIAWVVAIAR